MVANILPSRIRMPTIPPGPWTLYTVIKVLADFAVLCGTEDAIAKLCTVCTVQYVM